MKKIHQYLIRSTFALLAIGTAACGGGNPKAGPDAAAEKRPPILDKFAATEQLVANKEYEKAAVEFARIYQEQPKLLNALYNSAAAYEMAGKPATAHKYYSLLLQKRPDDHQALINFTRTAIANDDLQTAADMVDRQLAATPDDKELLLAKATILRLQKKADEAIDTARKIILRDQGNLEAMKIIGMSYVDLGQLDMATTFFNNALSMAPEDNSLMDNIGVIQFNKGDHSEALDTFNKSLAKNGNDAVALANVGLIALRFRDYQKASASLQQAIENGLNNCLTYKALGYSYEGLQQGEDAVKALNNAISICPPDIELKYDLAKIYNTQLRNYNLAKPLYNDYIAAAGKRKDEAQAALDLISQIEASQAQMDNMEAGEPADSAAE